MAFIDPTPDFNDPESISPEILAEGLMNLKTNLGVEVVTARGKDDGEQFIYLDCPKKGQLAQLVLVQDETGNWDVVEQTADESGDIWYGSYESSEQVLLSGIDPKAKCSSTLIFRRRGENWLKVSYSSESSLLANDGMPTERIQFGLTRLCAEGELTGDIIEINPYNFEIYEDELIVDGAAEYFHEMPDLVINTVEEKLDGTKITYTCYRQPTKTVLHINLGEESWVIAFPVPNMDDAHFINDSILSSLQLGEMPAFMLPEVSVMPPIGNFSEN